MTIYLPAFRLHFEALSSVDNAYIFVQQLLCQSEIRQKRSRLSPHFCSLNKYLFLCQRVALHVFSVGKLSGCCHNLKFIGYHFEFDFLRMGRHRPRMPRFITAFRILWTDFWLEFEDYQWVRTSWKVVKQSLCTHQIFTLLFSNRIFCLCWHKSMTEPNNCKIFLKINFYSIRTVLVVFITCCPYIDGRSVKSIAY